MPDFDELNKALAALRSQMDKAGTATEAINRLGAAADTMQKSTVAVESRLQACEKGIAAVEQAVRDCQATVTALSSQTTEQWQTATSDVLDRYGKTHVTAVASEVKKAGKDFSASVEGLRSEWQQRERSLRRARKWNVILIVVSLLLLIGLLFASGVLAKL